MRKPLRTRAPTHLGLALAAYQQKHDIPNEHMAKQIGISGATLSMIKSGTMPDGRTLTKILAWLTLGVAAPRKIRNLTR
jgi:transcriptional regulator with XRE-family HTH domain